MKIFKIALALTVLVSATTFSSCNKYEDGPGLSFKSPESRLATTWEVEKHIAIDGTETAGDSNDRIYTLTKDGELSIEDVLVDPTGTWSLEDDDTTLELNYKLILIDIVEEYTILRLTSDELWLERSNGSKLYLKEK